MIVDEYIDKYELYAGLTRIVSYEWSTSWVETLWWILDTVRFLPLPAAASDAAVGHDPLQSAPTHCRKQEDVLLLSVTHERTLQYLSHDPLRGLIDTYEDVLGWTQTVEHTSVASYPVLW